MPLLDKLRKVNTNVQKKDKIRVMWFSNSPELITGYAKVTREICGRLAKDSKFEVYVMGENYQGPPYKHELGFMVIGAEPKQFAKSAVNGIQQFQPVRKKF